MKILWAYQHYQLFILHFFAQHYLLFSIASQDISNARKILKESRKLEEEKIDSFLKYVFEVWEIFNATDTYRDQVSLPEINLPKEFQFIIMSL